MNIFIIAAVLSIVATIFFFVWRVMQKNKIDEERYGLRKVSNQVYNVSRLLARKKISLLSSINTSLPTAIKQQLEAEIDFLGEKIAYCNQILEIIEENKGQIKTWRKNYTLSQEYMDTPSFSHKYQLSSACKQFIKVIRKQDDKGLAGAFNQIKINSEKDRHAEATYVHKHVQKASNDRVNSMDLGAYDSLYPAVEARRQTA